MEAATEPLPPSFLAALHAVGDASCLDAVAAAHERATEPRWRAQLRYAFQTIARRATALMRERRRGILEVMTAG